MTPYPLIYCPKDVDKPACCAHKGGGRCAPDQGPDYVPGAPGRPPEGGGGMLWGGVSFGDLPFRRMPGGAYAQIGAQPSALLRSARHPRVLHRRWVQGAQPDHLWSVPVLLTVEVRPDGQDAYTPALDAVWDGHAWGQGELEPLFGAMLGFLHHRMPGGSVAERNIAFRRLAIDLLAIDQWVDEGLLAVNGWLSERFMTTVVLAAGGLAGEDLAKAAG